MTEQTDPSAKPPTGVPPNNLAVLGSALEHACLELFAEYGLQAKILEDHSPPEAPNSALVAAVDFNGPELRGMVVLSANQNVLLETTRAAPGMERTNAGLSDWTCELANQLVGRMKNKLRAYNVTIDVSVPRTLAGPAVSEIDPGVRYRFRCEAGTFTGFLEVMIAPGVVLEEGEPDPSLAQEGDLVFL